MTVPYTEHANNLEKLVIPKLLGSYNILSGKLLVTINMFQGLI